MKTIPFNVENLQIPSFVSTFAFDILIFALQIISLRMNDTLRAHKYVLVSLYLSFHVVDIVKNAFLSSREIKAFTESSFIRRCFGID